MIFVSIPNKEHTTHFSFMSMVRELSDGFSITAFETFFCRVSAGRGVLVLRVVHVFAVGGGACIEVYTGSVACTMSGFSLKILHFVRKPSIGDRWQQQPKATAVCTVKIF